MGIELQELYHHLGKEVSQEHFVWGSTPQSLFTFPGHYRSDETPRRRRIPCVLPAADPHCQYRYYSYLHRQKGFFVLSAICTSKHAQCRSETQWAASFVQFYQRSTDLGVWKASLQLKAVVENFGLC